MGEGIFFCLNEFRLRVAAHGLGGYLRGLRGVDK